MRWWLDPDADPGVWRPRLAAALRRVRRGEVANLKNGRRKRMYAVSLDGAEEQQLGRVAEHLAGGLAADQRLARESQVQEERRFWITFLAVFERQRQPGTTGGILR